MEHTEDPKPHPDLHLVKEEVFDAEVMSALLRDKSGQFPANVKKALSSYHRARIHGNRVRVVYDFGKDCAEHKVGRLFPKNGIGLQGFPFDIRNPLLDKHYWDVDMENAHYVLLAKLANDWGLKTEAICQYIANRDAELAKVSSNRGVAKVAFLKVAYGGNVSLAYDEASTVTTADQLGEDADLTLVKAVEAEMKNIVDLCWAKHESLQKLATKKANAKKPKANPRFSLFSLVLQTEERKCLEALDGYMRAHGRSVDIYIHDGAEIRKLDGEKDFPTHLLRGAEDAIHAATGYRHTLKVKPLAHNFAIPKGVGTIIDDSYAAKKFVELCGEYIARDGDHIYFFDTNTGMWLDTETAFRCAVNQHAAQLIFEDGEAVFNYGGCERNVANMRKWLVSHLPDTSFWKRTADSSMGKLLFADGIWCFDEGAFTEGFDHKIVFRKRINRTFDHEPDEDLVNEWNRILFIDPFDDGKDGLQVAEYYKKALTMGIYGDYLRKQFYNGVGDANCCKGTTSTALQAVFDEYVGEWDANNIKYNPRSGQDCAKALAWTVKLDGVRIAFANEFRMDGIPIDSNLLKSLSSGGDGIMARENFKDESKRVFRTTMVALANDLPACAPEDSGTRDRRRVIRFRNRFCENPTPGTNERKADPGIKMRFRDEKVLAAIFYIFAKCYEDMTADEKCVGKKLPCPPAVLEETAEWNGFGDEDFKAIIEEKYELTKSWDDFVRCDELLKFVERKGCRMSPQKAGRLLTALLNLPKWDTEQGNQPSPVVNGKKVRYGIRIRTEPVLEMAIV